MRLEIQTVSAKLRRQIDASGGRAIRRFARAPRLRLFRWVLMGVVMIASLQAQNGDSRYAGSFLELGIGARGMAMGGAYVAVADDGSAFYWNPAGVSTMLRPELFGMYASIFKSLAKHFHIGFSRPLYGAGAISVNWIRFTVPSIANYDSENLNLSYGERIAESTRAQSWQELQNLGIGLTDLPLGFSDFQNDALIISLSKLNTVDVDFGWQYFVLPVSIPVGMNFKLIRQSLFQRKASGVGLDVGAMMKFGLDDLMDDSRLGKFALGYAVKDVWNTKITWDTDSRRSDRIRRSWYLGAAYFQPIPNVRSQLLISYTLASKFELTHHFGMEYVYYDRLAIRFGVDNKQFTAGVGLRLSIFRFDYAFKGHELGGTHRISTAIQL